MLGHAKRLADGKPLYLTVTHFHPEHGFGAQVFADYSTIVYNREQRDELRLKGAGYIEMFKGIFGQHVATALEGVELIDPHDVYDGETEIDLGGHVVTLRTFGRAHTGGDQVVLVDGSVLFGGDLFETRMFPIVPYFPPDDVDVDGSAGSTCSTSCSRSNPAVVVPGHGEVTDATLIRDVRDYLAHIRGEATRLKAAGASADEAVAEIEPTALARWCDWDNPEWIGFAVRCFYDRGRMSRPARERPRPGWGPTSTRPRREHLARWPSSSRSRASAPARRLSRRSHAASSGCSSSARAAGFERGGRVPDVGQSGRPGHGSRARIRTRRRS